MTDPNLITAIEEIANNLSAINDQILAFIIVFVGFAVAHTFKKS